MSKKILFTILIGIAVVGLLNAIALYLENQNYLKTQNPIACVVGSSCEDVVNSEYGTTFGIKNELIGIGYYAIIIVLSLVILLHLNEAPNGWILIYEIISTVAFLFSLYLLAIQAFILHEFCFRCLSSLMINCLLFTGMIIRRIKLLK